MTNIFCKESSFDNRHRYSKFLTNKNVAYYDAFAYAMQYFFNNYQRNNIVLNVALFFFAFLFLEI